MKPLKLVLSTLIGFYAATSSAEQDIVVSGIQVWSSASGDNIIRVTTPGQAIINPDSCGDPDSYFVRTTSAKEVQARIYATLLVTVASRSGRRSSTHIYECPARHPAAGPCLSYCSGRPRRGRKR
jgi:hypothetical protein